jgi:hypothetical protein
VFWMRLGSEGWCVKFGDIPRSHGGSAWRLREDPMARKASSGVALTGKSDVYF